MTFKALSKTGSLGSCVIVSMDIGSSKWLARQNLQIPNTAETRIIPKWLFPPRFSDKHRFTSSRLVSVPSPQKQKSYRLAMKGGGFLGVAGCNCGRPRALQQHRQPPPADPFSPDSIDPKISAFFNISFTSSRSSTVRTLDRRTS